MMAPDPLYITELLALIEESTAPVRHDVRNRIASVRNLAFFVRRKLAAENDTERDPRVNEFLIKIESEVQRTDEVIDAWSTRVQGVRALDASPVVVNDSVRFAVECARVSPSITFALVAADDPLVIEGDFQALAFAVRCLLENAGEAVEAGPVSIRTLRDGGDCVIAVADRGPGIDDRTRCLARFETSKPGHLGLGLCMARRIATRFGGELVIGTPETGAEVSLRIPLAGARSPSPTGETP
jgi:signal transduction histidine kinase